MQIEIPTLPSLIAIPTTHNSYLQLKHMLYIFLSSYDQIAQGYSKINAWQVVDTLINYLYIKQTIMQAQQN